LQTLCVARLRPRGYFIGSCLVGVIATLLERTFGEAIISDPLLEGVARWLAAGRQLSAVVLTLGRDETLVATLRCLLAPELPPDEIVVVDQTPTHSPRGEPTAAWHEGARIRAAGRASIPAAMNDGLLAATGQVVSSSTTTEPETVSWPAPAHPAARRRSSRPGAAAGRGAGAPLPERSFRSSLARR
jgi:hypothetical protein